MSVRPKAVKKMLEKHSALIHAENQSVVSHTQRDSHEWVLHSLMLDGFDVPFKYKRRAKYKSLKGARVNLTYYADRETVAGLSFEIMRVVRIKRS